MLACTYDDFARVLQDAHALPEPAEAHGTLAGALCSSVEYGLTDWLREAYDLEGATAVKKKKAKKAKRPKAPANFLS